MKGLRLGTARSRAAVEKSITAVLIDVAPLLRIEHCQIELAEFLPDSGVLTVRIEGSCPDCLGTPSMFATAIEAHVKQRVPEVREVVTLDSREAAG